MSKNIETGIINYVPLYWIQAKFTTFSQSARRKGLQKSIRNHQESVLQKTVQTQVLSK